jgi:hypothetical protein
MDNGRTKKVTNNLIAKYVKLCPDVKTVNKKGLAMIPVKLVLIVQMENKNLATVEEYLIQFVAIARIVLMENTKLESAAPQLIRYVRIARLVVAENRDLAAAAARLIANVQIAHKLNQYITKTTLNGLKLKLNAQIKERFLL